MTERVNKALPSEEYDAQWRRLTDFIKYNPGARHRRRLMLKSLRNEGFTRGSILDAGCGLGETIEFLGGALPECSFTGVDLSPLAIESCQQRMPEHEWLVGDLSAPKAAGARFDLVVCSEVLEHLDDPATAVMHLAAMIKPDGLLLISVPHGRIFDTEKSFGHLRHPTTDDLETWLRDADLRVTSLQRWGWPAYGLVKRATNVSPDASMRQFANGSYGPVAKLVNHMAYAVSLVGSLPDSSRGVQTVLTARRADNTSA